MNGACFAAGTVSRVTSFEGGEGTWAEVSYGEDLVEVGWCVKED